MRKKLFAVIMSAMMMITFMPSMTFAAAASEIKANSWNADFSRVTLVEGSKSVEVSTTRTMQANGVIKVEPNYTEASGFHEPAPMYYYDMSALSFGGNLIPINYYSDSVLPTGVFGKDREISGSADPHVKFVWKAPEGVVDGNNATANESNTISNTVVKIKKPAYDINKQYEDQSFTLSVLFRNAISADGTTIKSDGTEAHPYRINVMPVKSVTIKADVVDATQIKAEDFLLGGKALTTAAPTVTYSGSEKVLELKKLPDVSVVYKMYDVEANQYKDVTAPSVKDAGVYEFVATVTSTKDSSKKSEINFTITVNPAEIAFGFPTTTAEAVKDSKYVARDYVKFVNGVAGSTTAEAYLSTAAALNQNLDSFNQWFDTVFDVKDNNGVLTIEEKEGAVQTSTTSQSASQTANYTFKILHRTCTLNFVEITENDVTACDQTKTFHVKKAKALKSKKTFMLTGDVADHGTLTYLKKSGNSKITIAKDGKVTVKKGLKKGTYKVKIKVKAPKANDIKTLKVKVVK